MFISFDHPFLCFSLPLIRWCSSSTSSSSSSWSSRRTARAVHCARRWTAIFAFSTRQGHSARPPFWRRTHAGDRCTVIRWMNFTKALYSCSRGREGQNKKGTLAGGHRPEPTCAAADWAVCTSWLTLCTHRSGPVVKTESVTPVSFFFFFQDGIYFLQANKFYWWSNRDKLTLQRQQQQRQLKQTL